MKNLNSQLESLYNQYAEATTRSQEAEIKKAILFLLGQHEGTESDIAWVNANL